jgi:uncharacterized protein (TIGR02271 family)
MQERGGAVPISVTQAEDGHTEQSDNNVVPIIHEEIVIQKRVVDTEKVRLEKTVRQHEEHLDIPLSSTFYEIERVIVNQPISHAPEIRQEGETTVYPILEERPVLTKQLFLKEELRVTKRTEERIDARSVTLSEEEINVEVTRHEK